MVVVEPRQSLSGLLITCDGPAATSSALQLLPPPPGWEGVWVTRIYESQQHLTQKGKLQY